ncbi:tail fiber domain-containing protein [Escherichia coli]
MSDNIFTGSGFKLYYNDDIGNQIPDNSGNEQINELAEMPSFGIKSEVQTIETYSSGYSEKLLAEQDIGNIEVVVNYLPDDPGHMFLDEATESQDEFQLTMIYNVENDVISYSMVNGKIQSASLSGDKDTVVTKTYSFVPTDVIMRDGTAVLSTPLVVGSYGVGSNGVDVAQYQPDLPDGNSFIKIPSSQVGNPAGSDMMGIGLIDMGTFSSLAMTKSGSLAIYAKNQNTAWQRILTSGLGDSKYVALTGDQTVAGNKTFSGDTKVNSLISTNGISGLSLTVTNKIKGSDIEVQSAILGAAAADTLTLGQALSVSNGGTGAKTAPLARKNLGISETATLDVIPIANGGTGATTLAQAQTNLGIVTSTAQDGKYLIKASNLSDLTNAATARTNLGLGTAAVQNTGTSGANVPLMNGNNSWSGTNNFNFATFKSTASNPLLIESITPSITFSQTDSPINKALFVLDGTTFRAHESTASGDNIFNYSFTDKTITFNKVAISNALPVTSGGTGGTSPAAARNSLGTFYENKVPLSTEDLNTLNGTQAGIYMQNLSSNATTARNYPSTIAGSLRVYQTAANNANSCIQIYSSYDAARTWKRVFNGTAWTAWKEDNTAGNITGIIPLANGGTGSATAAGARTNLDVPANNEAFLKKDNLAGIENNAAAWLNVRPVGATPLASDPVNDYDAATKRWVENLVSTGTTGPTMNGVMNCGVGSFRLQDSRTFTQPYDVLSDGQILKRADYPDLWAYAQMVSPIPDATWLGDYRQRGKYSTGDGSTTFRVPDRNGVQASSVAGLFARGDGGGIFGTGTVAQSGIPNITGGLSFHGSQANGSGSTVINQSTSGAFSGVSEQNNYSVQTPGPAAKSWGGIRFDASTSHPVYGRNTTEVVPNHFVGVWVIRATGSFVAANTSWSVINGDTTLPPVSTVVSGGSVISEYKIGTISRNKATFDTFEIAGGGAKDKGARISNTAGYNFRFNDDGSLGLPPNGNITSENNVLVLDAPTTYCGSLYADRGGTVTVRADERNEIGIKNERGPTSPETYVNSIYGNWYDGVWVLGGVRGGSTNLDRAQLNVQSGTGAYASYLFGTDGIARCQQWLNTSDLRVKENVVRISNPLDKMRKIQGVSWTLKTNGSTGHGFIAQEVEKVFPAAVVKSHDMELQDGTKVKDVKAVDTSGVAAALHHEAILALMDKADKQDVIINDQQLQIDELRAVVTQLLNAQNK